MQSGARSGEPRSDLLPNDHARSRDDFGVNTGEVPVAGDNTVPVTQGSDVSVNGLQVPADDATGGSSNDRPGVWQR